MTLGRRRLGGLSCLGVSQVGRSSVRWHRLAKKFGFTEV